MFRWHKTLDVLTLFHAPKNAQSTRVLKALKAASERAAESSISNSSAPVTAFELDVVEAPAVPTPTQLRCILEYVGADKVGSIVQGARSLADATKALEDGGEANSMRVLRPLLVDWNNGRAVLAPDEKAVKALVDTLPKQ